MMITHETGLPFWPLFEQELLRGRRPASQTEKRVPGLSALSLFVKSLFLAALTFVFAACRMSDSRNLATVSHY